MKPKKINQIVSSYISNDAVSHHVKNIQKNLKCLGFDGDIFCEYFDDATAFECLPIDEIAKFSDASHILIYHHSIGTTVVPKLLKLPDFIIVIYHNITPPIFFKDQGMTQACEHGLRQLHVLRNKCSLAWADSLYNARELMGFGFEDVLHLPLMRDYQALKDSSMDQRLEKALSHDNTKNIMFVGRIAPNKCHHDLILFFKIYKDIYGSRVRLILPGKVDNEYYGKLLNLCERLNLKVETSIQKDYRQAEVIFLKEVTNDQLATVYRTCDLFLCLSEHEGFCVPLIEAMFFGLPVVAHGVTAIPETCGEGAIIVDKNKPYEVIRAMNQLLEDPSKKSRQIQRSLAAAQLFDQSHLQNQFELVLNRSLQVFSNERGCQLQPH